MRKTYRHAHAHAEGSSDSFVIVSCLVIFFFLFQWLIIYSIATIMQCAELSEFWLGASYDRINPYTMSVAIFGLLVVWSVVDVIRALYLHYNDRIQSVIVCLTVILCFVHIARGMWAQWEYFEVSRGVLQPKDSIFLKIELMPFRYPQQSNSWQDFIKNKRCQDSFYSLNIESEKGWRELRAEWISTRNAQP